MNDAVKPSRRSSLTISDRFGNQQANCWFYRFFWSTSGAPPPHRRSYDTRTVPPGLAAVQQRARERARFPRGELSSPDLAWWKFEKKRASGLTPVAGPFMGGLRVLAALRSPRLSSRCPKTSGWWEMCACDVLHQLFLHDWGFCVFTVIGIRKSSCIISCLTVQRLTGSAWHQSARPKRPTASDLISVGLRCFANSTVYGSSVLWVQ